MTNDENPVLPFGSRFLETQTAGLWGGQKIMEGGCRLAAVGVPPASNRRADSWVYDGNHWSL